MKRYNPQEIEKKWQKYWDDNQTYKADLKSDKPKYIAMSMFNYPSGAGIHIGHAMNYTISDVLARFKRQQGFESYHPVGWDAFGLPAENYAIKAGVSPQESMKTIIPNYHKQYRAMGWSNDWSKEIATHEPTYYKWTQWIFSEMYRAGLAYQDVRMQWWCNKCQTVLANEQIESNGKCWRHDGPDDEVVTQREVKQWFFKITDYADELLAATEALDWTESVKLAQKNWIGRSEGAIVKFKLDGLGAHDQTLDVFTTAHDTIYGATFMVVAPEHDIVARVFELAENAQDIDDYVQKTRRKSELERETEKEKTGVPIEGLYAINPANGEKVPVWIADYVLMGYGTGAVMAVPAHDERDNQFARKYKLPIVPVAYRDFGEKAENEDQIQGVVVLGYDRATGKHLGLRNSSGSLWLVGGGINDGESYEDCARRELKEETGYEAEQMISLGSPIYSHYYNEKKNSHRRSYAENFLAVIDSSRQQDHGREDHEDFVPEWFDFEDLYQGITETGGGVEHWLHDLTVAKATVENGLVMPDQFISYTDEIKPNKQGFVLANSGDFTGQSYSTGRQAILDKLIQDGSAEAKVNYKIRDWSVTRQRYWGAPTPIIYCPDHGPVLVPDSDLPVVLPELEDFQPSGDGRSALARATDWLKAPCPTCGKEGERETDTLDTYICSSWYMMRYLDPENTEKIFDSGVVNKWMPIDFYNGADHATAHMIYARFVTRFFHKKGLVENPEPFKKFLFNGKVVNSDGRMFSKSKGVVIDPLEIIDDGYGADALRTYLMFAAPLELWARWDPQGVPGTYRFLARIWALTQEFLESPKADADVQTPEIMRAIHKAIKKVTEDVEQQKYNTAIAAMMQCVNELYKIKSDKGFGDHKAWQFALESMAQLVAPFAPHIAEELWHDLGRVDSVNKDNWPKLDEKYLTSDQVNIAVQINGKVRATIQVAANADQQAAEDAAYVNDQVKQHLGDKKPAKVVYVPGRLLSLVV